MVGHRSSRIGDLHNRRVLNYAGPIIWNDDATYFYYFAAVSILDQDQVWGCASCGPGYESAWMTHYYAKGVHYSWPTPYDQGDITLGAVTHVRLYTGGKAQIKRQNLFCINAWADEYFKAPYYGWWLTQSQSVDKVSLTVLGKHPGSDGNVWVVLPDNSEQDITVHAPKQHYNAWASPTKYEFSISANGVPLDPSMVVPGADFCVGQFISFSLSGPPDGMATDFQWSFGGHYFNDQRDSVFGETYPTCSIDYFVNPSLLTSNETMAWWVSGGPDANTPATYDASVNFTLNFHNGQAPITLSEDGLFHMYRPTATISPVTGTVNLEFLSSGTFLMFGDSFNDIPGIKFLYTITYPPNFSGSTEWVQVVLSSEGSMQDIWGTNHVAIQTGSAPFLDIIDPYGTFDAAGNPNDSPGQGIGTAIMKVDTSDSFEMTMMFDPPEGGMRVPLRAVDWSWNGSATNSGTGWGWGGTGSAGADFDTEIYSQWNAIFSEYPNWNPPLP